MKALTEKPRLRVPCIYNTQRKKESQVPIREDRRFGSWVGVSCAGVLWERG